MIWCLFEMWMICRCFCFTLFYIKHRLAFRVDPHQGVVNPCFEVWQLEQVREARGDSGLYLMHVCIYNLNMYKNIELYIYICICLQANTKASFFSPFSLSVLNGWIVPQTMNTRQKGHDVWESRILKRQT